MIEWKPTHRNNVTGAEVMMICSAIHVDDYRREVAVFQINGGPRLFCDITDFNRRFTPSEPSKPTLKITGLEHTNYGTIARLSDGSTIEFATDTPITFSVTPEGRR